MRILILDDEKTRHVAFGRKLKGELKHVWNVPQFREALKKGPYDEVWLDHDLGTRGTGVDAARALAELPKAAHPKRVVIHSWNHGGAANIASVLKAAGITHLRQPFSL